MSIDVDHYQASIDENTYSAAGIDYSLTIIPSNITLSAAARHECAELSINKDKLVEGQESFNVYFDVDSYSGSYTLNGSNVTKVTILDSNGKNTH